MRRLLACGVLSLGLHVVPQTRGGWGPGGSDLAPVFGLLILAYLAAVWGVWRLSGGSPWEGGNAPVGEGRLLLVVWALAILHRLAVLPGFPTLSDDMYRYLWDGRVLLSGLNPYRFPPDAPELQAMMAEFEHAARINHPTLPTIYPPLLMLVFAGAAWISPTVLGWKTICVLCELAAAWFLMRALRDAGRPALWVVVWLWHPLVIAEFAGSGHADAVGILLVAIAFWAWTRTRWMESGIALALAGLVKFLPWVALPALLPRLRWRWLLLPALPVLAYLPFRAEGVNALGSLGVFAAKWRSNDYLFALLPGGSGSGDAALLVAKRIAAGLAGIVWVWALFRRRSLPSVYAWSLGAILLLSPVVHPWYVLWLLPAVLLVPHPAWWIWSLTVVLAYEPLPRFLAGGAWSESTAIKSLEYLPVLVLVPVQAWWERRRLRGG